MTNKWAVMADIHGNSFALEAVLENIYKRGITNIINLGDIFYGPLDPQGTFELLAKHEIIAISGNMDRLIVEASATLFKHPHKIIDNPTLLYDLQSISKEAVEWLSRLPKTRIIEETMYLCHGNKETDDIPLIEEITSSGVRIKTDAELSEAVKDIKQNIILCAHTHVPRFIHLENGKQIINPGSVGLQAYEDEEPFHHQMQTFSPHAKYCIVEIENESVVCADHIAISYDWKRASEMAVRNTRKDWAVSILTGR